MTVHEAEQQARKLMGSRIDVDRRAEGWIITQWGLTDSGYKHTRTLSQHPDWTTALHHAMTRRRDWTDR